MVATYNPDQPSFTNKIQMVEYEGASSGKISQSVIFGVECDSRKLPGSKISYVTPFSGATDNKSFYHANMQLATSQCPDLGVIGELWVDYKVTLRKKRLFTNTLQNATYSVVQTLGPVENNWFTGLGNNGCPMTGPGTYGTFPMYNLWSSAAGSNSAAYMGALAGQLSTTLGVNLFEKWRVSYDASNCSNADLFLIVV
jgi:hypothetical protein